MSGVDTLRNLPLSQLFAGPLVAAIDASVQSQRATVDLLLESGFDDEGNLVTVAFEYPAPATDPEAGESIRTTRRLEVPLVLFLTLPNLQINRIEEEFAAEITSVEETEGTEGELSRGPLRLGVRPASQSTEFTRRRRSRFDLDVRMVAEVRNESTGMELLERAANEATFGPPEESGADERERITPGRDDRPE